MEVLRLLTKDYELTVRADGVDAAYKKASLRNTSIESSTEYGFLGENVISFELATAFGNKLELPLSNVSFNIPSHPVFFENKDYYFDVFFNGSVDEAPVIYTSLEEVKKSFISRKIHDNYFLTGAINYRNDIGKSDFIVRYKTNGKLIQHTLSFEVFPVKLDYKSSYKSIIVDINNEFSSLVFDILKKTYSGFKNGDDVTNDIIWWSIFGRLYKDLIFSAKLILNRPHNRLIQDSFYIKADRIRELNYDLEEQVSEHKCNAQKYFSVQKERLTIDNFENQFFKYSIFFVYRKFNITKNKILNINERKTTDEFKVELNLIEKEFSAIINNPFFKQISDFKGLKQESLILHRATGYSTLFRTLIILKRGIDFLDGVNNIELKNIAELYEIWCFIEMKNMIQRILNKTPEEVNLAEILVNGFNLQMKEGTNSKISFIKQNGDLVELFHELKYTKSISGNTLSHTVDQKPDIVLRITKKDFKENITLTYLFDAKYRLAPDSEISVQDCPPEDAINQMHRYRDAIFYQDHQESERPKKEIIGAFVLFPGANEINEVKEQYFHKSIKKVNIGAYPLVPGMKKYINNSLLIDFLTNILVEKETLQILNEDIAPYKALKYEEPDSLVLAGFVSNVNQANYFLSGNATIYHMPIYKKDGSFNTVRHLDKLKYFCPIINGVSEYYEIEDVKVMQRKDIFDYGHLLFKNTNDTYLVFSLKNKRILNKKIETSIGGNRVFRYARLSELNTSNTILDFNKAHLEVG